MVRDAKLAGVSSAARAPKGTGKDMIPLGNNCKAGWSIARTMQPQATGGGGVAINTRPKQLVRVLPSPKDMLSGNSNLFKKYTQ
jgi:hypothetical protein